jgi:hypothetical protein
MHILTHRAYYTESAAVLTLCVALPDVVEGLEVGLFPAFAA